jgi:hypothetical protein
MACATHVVMPWHGLAGATLAILAIPKMGPGVVFHRLRGQHIGAFSWMVFD